MMGAADLSASSATPAHMVTLTHAYCMDVTEVTVAAYAACVAGGACTATASGSSSCNQGVAGRGNHPINCVTWDQARAYCQSVGKDLPTEAQWEYAARGAVTEPVYPWGMQAPDDTRLCWNGGAENNMGTCPVGHYPAAAFGLFDMAGNVWEWTRDCFASYDPGGAALSDPGVPFAPTCSSADRVYRGGGWGDSYAVYVRAAFRYGSDPSLQGDDLGFRCARGL